jgi:hypothetical protein
MKSPFSWPKMKMRLDDDTVIEIAHRYALRILHKECEYSIGFENACEKNIARLIHAGSIERFCAEGNNTAVSDEERSIILSKVAKYCQANALSYRVV